MLIVSENLEYLNDKLKSLQTAHLRELELFAESLMLTDFAVRIEKLDSCRVKFKPTLLQHALLTVDATSINTLIEIFVVDNEIKVTATAPKISKQCVYDAQSFTSITGSIYRLIAENYDYILSINDKLVDLNARSIQTSNELISVKQSFIIEASHLFKVQHAIVLTEGFQVFGITYHNHFMTIRRYRISKVVDDIYAHVDISVLDPNTDSELFETWSRTHKRKLPQLFATNFAVYTERDIQHFFKPQTNIKLHI